MVVTWIWGMMVAVDWERLDFAKIWEEISWGRVKRIRFSDYPLKIIAQSFFERVNYTYLPSISQMLSSLMDIMTSPY